jgi:FKBP-type peptidyl-prolyl cis-trans isomerase
VFDSSRRRGQPFEFKIGAQQVIEGLDQAVRLLSKGTHATIVLPPRLGYGDKGMPPICPPDATLKYEIEVQQIEGVLP